MEFGLEELWWDFYCSDTLLSLLLLPKRSWEGYPVVNDPLYNHTVFGPEKGRGGNIGKSDEDLIRDLINIHNAENWLGMDGDSELSMFKPLKSDLEDGKGMFCFVCHIQFVKQTPGRVNIPLFPLLREKERGRFGKRLTTDVFSTDSSEVRFWDKGVQRRSWSLPGRHVVTSPVRHIGMVSLLISHHGKPDLIPSRVTPDFRLWESCRMMPLVGGFTLGSRVSPALSVRHRSVLTVLHPRLLSRPQCYGESVPRSSPGIIRGHAENIFNAQPLNEPNDSSHLKNTKHVREKRDIPKKTHYSIIRHDSHMRKSERCPAGNQTWFSLDGVALECKGGGTGVTRENLPASSIVQHVPHMRKSGSEPAGNLAWFTVMGGERPSHCATAAPNEILALIMCVVNGPAGGSEASLADEDGDMSREASPCEEALEGDASLSAPEPTPVTLQVDAGSQCRTKVTVATQTGHEAPDLSFNGEKMTTDPHCYECKVRYRDPKPKDLVMYLHAWKYKLRASLITDTSMMQHDGHTRVCPGLVYRHTDSWLRRPGNIFGGGGGGGRCGPTGLRYLVMALGARHCPSSVNVGRVDCSVSGLRGGRPRA
ncbi:hypothetical protein PR048_019104 [Dryococelus australis]|uniref:Uncharacterized protein n=1 Tax=Dryococelus australis TaxID=614101 RepID=A0ABQ9H2X8_9NEOP|nr:hypothetical protein PR048_019104 [Dryococelus australis]